MSVAGVTLLALDGRAQLAALHRVVVRVGLGGAAKRRSGVSAQQRARARLMAAVVVCGSGFKKQILVH